jgi:hypothetical protein
MASSHLFRGLPVGLPSHINFSGHNWNGTTNIPIPSHSAYSMGGTECDLSLRFSVYVACIVRTYSNYLLCGWLCASDICRRLATPSSQFSFYLFLFVMVPLCYWRDSNCLYHSERNAYKEQKAQNLTLHILMVIILILILNLHKRSWTTPSSFWLYLRILLPLTETNDCAESWIYRQSLHHVMYELWSTHITSHG